MNIYIDSFAGCIAKKIVFSLLLIGVTTNSLAQNISTGIVQPFDTYRKNALQEKIFVHTDKEFYLAGEICWFKIYTVDAFFHQPLDLSKVAYTELLDNNNKPVVQAKIALQQGDGYGSCYLPVNINSGNYKLRAYSNWMKNTGPEYFFEKTLRIINTQQIPVLSAQPAKPSYDIQLFPEGGNLVNGIQSKIAFKIVDQAGRGADCNGVLVNNKRDTLAKFQSLKFGIGSFSFSPVAGQHYSAIVTVPGGKTVHKDLPQAYNSGYVMSLVGDGEKQLNITVQSAGDEPANSALVYLFVHTRGSIKEAASGTIKNGIANFIIDKDKLGEGISHITIFNSNHQPVCERLYFKKPVANVILQLGADKQEYNLREKIKIDIAASEEQSKPLAADMSMAVYKVDSLQMAAAAGISEYLWLTSDLPGNVESPEYYFNGTDATVSQATDNLMLTNGWRRFKWQDVLKNKKPGFQFAPEFNGHVITGEIISSKTGKPAANIDTYFSVPGTTRFRTAVSDSNGHLQFEIKNFYGTPGIILQPANVTDSALQFHINNPFFNGYSARPVPPFEMPAKAPETLLGQSISMQVANIYHGDTLKKVNGEIIDTASFYEHPNEIYQLDNYVRFATMEEVLREYVLSVNVRKRGNAYHLPVFNDGEQFNEIFEENPLVLLDGVPVFDMNKIIQYDPLKVKKLEAVTRKYYYGRQDFEGVVSLQTYNGDLEGFELDPNATVIDYEALQLQREFYSPVYETAEQAGSHLPDFRNVLNWSPAIKTGKDGRYAKVFYSGDLPGKYVVIVQALTADGKTGSGSMFFEVKKPVKLK